MNLKNYNAISLTDICAMFVEFGGTREEFDSFVTTVLDCAYTWGDAAHTLVTLEGFLENLAGDTEAEWPSEAWRDLYTSLSVFLEHASVVYVDLET